jgi:hypothetical protein
MAALELILFLEGGICVCSSRNMSCEGHLASSSMGSWFWFHQLLLIALDFDSEDDNFNPKARVHRKPPVFF